MARPWRGCRRERLWFGHGPDAAPAQARHGCWRAVRSRRGRSTTTVTVSAAQNRPGEMRLGPWVRMQDSIAAAGAVAGWLSACKTLSPVQERWLAGCCTHGRALCSETTQHRYLFSCQGSGAVHHDRDGKFVAHKS
jgi:hypothetical protein